MIDIDTNNLSSPSGLSVANTNTKAKARSAQSALIQQLENLANSDITTNSYKYDIVGRSRSRPWMGLTVNKNTLDFLKDSPLVTSIEENLISGHH